MKTIVCKNEAGFSMTFAQQFWGGFVLTDATGILETHADVIRTANAMGDGAIWNNSRMPEREITLSLRDDPATDHRINRMRLFRLFPLREPVTLTYTDGNTARCITVYCESIEAELKRSSDSYKITLIAPDPFFRDTAMQDVNISSWEDAWEWPVEGVSENGLFEFAAATLEEDVLEYGTRTEDLIINCENSGDVPCGMVVTFAATGATGTPGLLNVDTGERMQVNYQMHAGDAITVDTRFGHRTAVLTSGGTETNVFRYVDAGSVFLQLRPGTNNFTATIGGQAATSADLDITIRYETQYIGA